MNSTGHLPVSESTARPARKARRQPRAKARPAAEQTVVRAMPAVGTLTRTKALLLAALRVWELKHRITD